MPPRTAPAQQVPVRQQAPAQPQAPAQQPAPRADTGTLGDTTRTGIIKGFLLKMAPDANVADTTALNQGKKPVPEIFPAIPSPSCPDENGKLREPGKKKRGLFGLRSAEDTDEYVPINVSLGRRRIPGGKRRDPPPSRNRSRDPRPSRSRRLRRAAPPKSRTR